MALIALDADGVLLDYHAAYRGAWSRAFGSLPSLRDPHAYWPIDRWDVERLFGARLAHFRSHFNEEFWSSIPPCEGAVEACHRLRAAGYDLVCVSAIEDQFLAARTKNIQDCGFPIDRVYATHGAAGPISPKAKTLTKLSPVAFVDDYLPYMRGLPADIHAALVIREPNGSPNTGDELRIVQSQHKDLDDFSTWWLANS